MKFSAVLFSLIAAATVSAAPLEKRSSGTATYYYQNGNPGNCGWYSQDSDYVVALQTSMYAGGAHCGQMITIKNDNTGATIQAKVADSCPSCGSYEDIDLSSGAFGALANYNDGVFPATWWFD